MISTLGTTTSPQLAVIRVTQQQWAANVTLNTIFDDVTQKAGGGLGVGVIAGAGTLFHPLPFFHCLISPRLGCNYLSLGRELDVDMPPKKPQNAPRLAAAAQGDVDVAKLAATKHQFIQPLISLKALPRRCALHVCIRG